MGLLMMTMVSPPFVSALAYIQLFGRWGMITHRLLGLSINPYGWGGIVAMQSLSFVPLNALLLMGVLSKVDQSLIHASRDLGAGPSRTLRDVILPLIRPAMLVCFLLSFIRSLSDFGTPMIIGGRFNVLAPEIYLQIIGYSNLPRASAMNVVILIPALVIFIFYRLLMRNSLFSASDGKTGELQSGFHLKGMANLLLSSLAALFYGMMLLQYGSILVGFINNFTSAMTTVGAVIFLIHPGKKIAVFALFDAVNSGEYGLASLIATFIIMITLLVNLGLSEIMMRGRR